MQILLIFILIQITHYMQKLLIHMILTMEI